MIRKAVIPVAGFGTRLLPLTKALPKEMLPIVGRPVIQIVVDELAAAGIEDVIIVTALHKELIQQHFAPNPSLERHLLAAGKTEMAHELRQLSTSVRISYMYQDGPYGNGTPVANAARVIGDEPFLVLWADDFFVSAQPRAKQLIDAYAQVQGPVLALTEVKPAETTKYGIAGLSRKVAGGLYELDSVVEKPAAGTAPSNFACVGGYVITPGIVSALEKLSPDHTGEVYLAQALHNWVTNGGPLFGQVIDGTWYDTGTFESYVHAFVDAALRDPDLGPGLRAHLAGLPQ